MKNAIQYCTAVFFNLSKGVGTIFIKSRNGSFTRTAKYVYSYENFVVLFGDMTVSVPGASCYSINLTNPVSSENDTT